MRYPARACADSPGIRANTTSASMRCAVSTAVKSGVDVRSHPDTARKRHNRDANCFARVTEPAPDKPTASATTGRA